MSYVKYFDRPVVLKPRRVMYPTICMPSDLAHRFYALAQEIEDTIVHDLIWGKGVTDNPMPGIMGRP